MKIEKMEEFNLISGFQKLEQTINNLMVENNALKKENVRLRSENEGKKIDLENKSQLILEFQNKVNTKTIINSIGVEDKDAAELKEIINQYINEIDRCISYLSK